MSYKHQLHGRLLEAGWAGVEELLTSGEQEAVDLEFKNKFDAANGVAERKDREILGQTLTAFANSMGGLLVSEWIVAQPEAALMRSKRLIRSVT